MKVTITEPNLYKQVCFTYNRNSVIDILNDTSPIVLAFDPSKSNMAVVIGRPSGEIIKIIELSGTGLDTTQFCYEFKEFLIQYISKCKVVGMAYEKVIRATGEKASYISMVVTNEIQSHLIDLGITLLHSKDKVIGINNWAWKNAVLPDMYRKKDLKIKGSKLYLQSLNSKFKGFKDDVTDVICIYFYYIKTFIKFENIFPNTEEIRDDVNVCLCTFDKLPDSYTTFQYNPKISLKGNASYMKNRIQGNIVTEIKNELSIKEVYELPCNFGESDKFYLLIY